MDESLKLRGEGASPSQHRVSHKDLRDLLRDFEAMRELKVIEGADPHLEIAALAETITMRYPGEEPALLFGSAHHDRPVPVGEARRSGLTFFTATGGQLILSCTTREALCRLARLEQLRPP